MGKIVAHIAGLTVIAIAVYAIPYAFFAGVLGFFYTLLDTRPGAEERRTARQVEATQQSLRRPASAREIAEKTIREMTRVALTQRGRELFISISSSNDTNYEATLSGFYCNFLLSPDFGPRGHAPARAVRQVLLRPGETYRQEFLFPFDRSSSAVGSSFGSNISFRIIEYRCDFNVSAASHPLSSAGSPRNPLLLR